MTDLERAKFAIAEYIVSEFGIDTDDSYDEMEQNPTAIGIGYTETADGYHTIQWYANIPERRLYLEIDGEVTIPYKSYGTDEEFADACEWLDYEALVNTAEEMVEEWKEGKDVSYGVVIQGKVYHFGTEGEALKFHLMRPNDSYVLEFVEEA